MSVEIIHAHDTLAVLWDMVGASVDAVITDPPYSSGGAFRSDRMTDTTTKYVQTGTALRRPDFDGDNRDQHAFEYWCVLWMSECLRIAKPGAPFLTFTDWRQLAPTIDALQAAGWIFRGVVPWDKGEGVRPFPGRFRAQAEFIVWGSRGPMAVERGVSPLPGAYAFPVLQSDKHHITGKPTGLMRKLVRICEPGGVILDPFAGSFTTGIAAVIEGYRFVGIERSAEYIDVGRRRLAEARDESIAEAVQPTLFEIRPEVQAAIDAIDAPAELSA